MYIDLYPDVSDTLNTLARDTGMSKKQLLHNIITEYIAHGTKKKR